ncbi:MAG: MarC family protein [Caulobacteraceae bacterium]
MSTAEFAINFFVALFALIDPVGNVPLFAAATEGATTPGRRLTALYIALFAFVFLGFFYVTGIGVLRFFGISMPAFRIAGGILLLFLGLDMARGDLLHSFADSGVETKPLTTRAYAAQRFESLIVPFGIPLLIGPGAISSAVIYAEEGRRFGPAGLAIGLGVIAAVCVLIVVAFWLTNVISRVLGKVGMVIVVRVLGLILCAMAVQFMLTGLAGSTIGLMRRDTASPYQRPAPSAGAARLAGHEGRSPVVR